MEWGNARCASIPLLRKRFRTEDKLMSIFLKDPDINDSNELQFSRDRLQVGGRWLDDIVGNS